MCILILVSGNTAIKPGKAENSEQLSLRAYRIGVMRTQQLVLRPSGGGGFFQLGKIESIIPKQVATRC